MVASGPGAAGWADPPPGRRGSMAQAGSRLKEGAARPCVDQRIVSTGIRGWRGPVGVLAGAPWGDTVMETSEPRMVRPWT